MAKDNRKIRIIPFGGMGEIGKNMFAFEYEDEILLIDGGLAFPDADMLGVDILVPKIDWVVKDPGGKSLGTVSQENKIPAGSLDGQWGGTATAAAVAATQGILKLLPQQTASR